MWKLQKAVTYACLDIFLNTWIYGKLCGRQVFHMCRLLLDFLMDDESAGVNLA